MNQKNNFLKGLLKENPLFVLVLGTCPSLAVTTSLINGLGMGLATTFVLLCSNMAISLIKNFIPDKVRIPCYITVIASFVTIVDLLMSAYAPALHEKLGIFIPLIVVNCIILGRAEAFAAKNNVISSLVDALGMGLGFSLALTLIGGMRELLGAGSFLGTKLIATDGILLFILPPGAFICLGFLIAVVNFINKQTGKKR